MQEIINKIVTAFSKNAIASKKPKMEAYMKNKFLYYGLPSPIRKEVSKPYLKELVAGNFNIEEVAKLLRQKPEREWQYLAQDYLVKCHKQWQPKHLKLFKHLTITKSWWDTVDMIATNLVGALLLKYPELKSKMNDWNKADDLWLNRVSILYQLKYREATDIDRLFAYCKNHANSKEFFHQKAIGWALRELAKREPKLVVNFVKSNNLAILSEREALKHLNVKS